MLAKQRSPEAREIAKAATGIAGLDDVTMGGLPAGRPTLICGSAGCGKTLFGMTFLVKGATEFGEPGVLMSFEETSEELAANVRSLGYDVEDLIAKKRLAIDFVRIERSEIAQSGDYDLEGIFVRLDYAIKQTGAKRVVLDTLEALFAGLDNEALLRSELRRLFAWLKARGVTAIITAERGDGQLTRHGFEEYVSDCVILLDNRVEDQITTRRLRVVKYRGSAHGTNEYPFLIDQGGISVLPITMAGLSHQTSDEVVSTGIPTLDEMFAPGGLYRGSSVLVSGGSGTGKTIFGASFAGAACKRGERCIYFAFEESPEQILRNMRSIGLDLQPHVKAGLLRLEAARPSLFGFEMHLALMHRAVETFAPNVVVIDPISAFRGSTTEIHATLLRLVDLLKCKGVTGVFTNLTGANDEVERSDLGLSSLMDTWISLHNVELNGERNRLLYVLKSRGMSRSNQVREYALSDNGVHLSEAYIGPQGVVTGSARVTQAAQEKAAALERRQDIERKGREFEAKRASVERQISEMQAALKAEAKELGLQIDEAKQREDQLAHDEAEMAARRGAAE